MMAPDKIVDAAIKGLQFNKSEIYPGLARVLLIMSRLGARLFMLKQTSKVGAKYMLE